MNLKPQDIFALLKLVALRHEQWTYNSLAVDLGMSPSEVHAALKRAKVAQLAINIQNEIQVNLSFLKEFIFHGIKYVFVPERGGITRGIPTGYAAPPLNRLLTISDDPPPVWPIPTGELRGESFSPLYKSVPMAAQKDPNLYELLVLVDAIRGGKARERDIAIQELKLRLT
jgi:hypothetical protein